MKDQCELHPTESSGLWTTYVLARNFKTSVMTKEMEDQGSEEDGLGEDKGKYEVKVGVEESLRKRSRMCSNLSRQDST